MKTKTFGNTGLQVSELVLGAGWVGGLFIHQDDDVKRAALRRAIDAGINWIDTAGDYGQGQSEQALGRLLAELAPAERPRISTKVRLDLESAEPHASQIRRGVETSLQRLGLDRVTLFQLHNPIQPQTTGQQIGVEAMIADGGVADMLLALRDEGLADHIGFTALGDSASCRRVVESGKVESAQIYYNLLNPTAGLTHRPGALAVQDFSGLMDACARHGVAVMNIRVFAAGVLATTVRHGREIPITDEAQDLSAEERRAEAVLAVAGRAGETGAQTAIQFSLANPMVSCVVIGLAELDHLEQALAASVAGPLPAASLSALDAVWAGDFGL